MIVVTVLPGCTRAFVEVRIASNYKTVAATVASSSLPLLFRVFVAAKAASNSAVSVVSVADASMLAAVAGTIGASNWSVIAVTFANTGYSAVIVRKTKMFASAAKRAGGKSAFVAVDATIASSFDRVAEESERRSSMVAKVMIASN